MAEIKIRVKKKIRKGNGAGRRKSIAALATELEKRVNDTCMYLKECVNALNNEVLKKKQRADLCKYLSKHVEDLEPVDSLIQCQWPEMYTFIQELKKL